MAVQVTSHVLGYRDERNRHPRAQADTIQVADRLAEAEERRPVAAVECHGKLRGYLVAKEIAWVAAFALSGMWPAIAGSLLFLAYPLWRRFYRHWRAA